MGFGAERVSGAQRRPGRLFTTEPRQPRGAPWPPPRAAALSAIDRRVGARSLRIERASKAERLKRSGIPLFPNWRARRSENPDLRWIQSGLRDEWESACDKVGVRNVSVYPGTKHTTATDLIRRGYTAKQVQRVLGHASERSTDAYVVLADTDTIDVFRRKRP